MTAICVISYTCSTKSYRALLNDRIFSFQVLIVFRSRPSNKIRLHHLPNILLIHRHDVSRSRPGAGSWRSKQEKVDGVRTKNIWRGKPPSPLPVDFFRQVLSYSGLAFLLPRKPSGRETRLSSLTGNPRSQLRLVDKGKVEYN